MQQMKPFLLLLPTILSCLVWTPAAVAEKSPKIEDVAAVTNQVTYLGNEALLVENDSSKVLFDPFFHNSYNIYQAVPDQIRSAIFAGDPPYDGIDAIFVSHAHGDHFDAADLVGYLQSFPNTRLIAPQQAVDQIMQLEGAGQIKDSLMPIGLEYRDTPITKNIGTVSFDAVRIPHAGWPQRANISNLVYRVTLNSSVTVIHMGDADPDDEHFAPLMDYWQRQATDVAFPPYWFFVSREGPMILKDRIQAVENIGVHVPVKVPEDLRQSGANYFSKPGEQLTL